MRGTFNARVGLGHNMRLTTPQAKTFSEMATLVSLVFVSWFFGWWFERGSKRWGHVWSKSECWSNQPSRGLQLAKASSPLMPSHILLAWASAGSLPGLPPSSSSATCPRRVTAHHIKICPCQLYSRWVPHICSSNFGPVSGFVVVLPHVGWTLESQLKLLRIYGFQIYLWFWYNLKIIYK